MSRKIYQSSLFLFLLLMPLLSRADGNQSLGNSYGFTKCGLNYTTASVVLGKRGAGVTVIPGVSQPAPLNVILPPCAVIEKAFLYAEYSGNGAAQTATLSGPAGSFSFPMTLIGEGPDKNWGYTFGPNGDGSFGYRADVTSAISTSGVYNVSGLSTNPFPATPSATTNDVDGASLIVIYSVPGTPWTGTIIIDDGIIEGCGVASIAHTMNFAAVCGNTANASAFIGAGDLQPINPPPPTPTVVTLNGTIGPNGDDWWDLFSTGTTVGIGQTTAAYSIAQPADCFDVVFTGLYYQTTTCQTCTLPVITLDSSSTPDHCESCDGTATIIPSSNVQCLNYQYFWSSGETTATITGKCAGTYTVTVSAIDAATNTVITTATGTVTVDAYGHLFTPTGIPTNPLCHDACNGTITVNPNGGAAPYTYTWIPAAAGTGPTVSGLCPGTFMVVVKDSFNCIGKDTFILTQPPIVPPPTPYDVVYCQYETSIALTATITNTLAGHTLRWYTTPTGGVGTPTAPVPSTTIPGVFIWYVAEADTLGCESPRVPLNVYIKAKPLPPVSLHANYVYCQFDSTAVQLTAVGDSLKWYTTPQGGIPSFLAPTPQTSVLGVFTWYVTQTTNGCESDMLPITVGIFQKPEPPVTKDIFYCQGDTAVPLTAIGNDLLWYLLPTGGSAQPLPTPVTTIPDTVTWYVAANNHGCESERTPLKVIIKYRPTAHILFSNDSVCQFDSLTYQYSGNAYPTATWMWEWPVGATVLSGNDSTPGPITVKFDTTGLYFVSLTVADNGCFSPKVSVPVQVKILPVTEISVSSRNACKDDTIQVGINYSNMQINKFWWDFDGGITPYGSSGTWGADDGGPYNIYWTTAGIHPLHLHTQGINQCFSLPDAIDTVFLHDRPEAKIESISANDICSGDSIRLSASTNKPGYSYQWTPKQFFDDGDNTSVVNAYVETTHYVNLRVTNEYGCASEDSVLINTKPCCDIFMPDAFSPNGDGKNDLFRIVDLGRHVLTDFRIVNRWGEIVFNTADPKQGWDGSHEGVAQDIDVYYYVVQYKCDGKSVTKTGQVTLIR